MWVTLLLNHPARLSLSQNKIFRTFFSFQTIFFVFPLCIPQSPATYPVQGNVRKSKLKIKPWKLIFYPNILLAQFQCLVFGCAPPHHPHLHQHHKIGHSWGLIVSLLPWPSGKCSSESAGGWNSRFWPLTSRKSGAAAKTANLIS